MVQGCLWCNTAVPAGRRKYCSSRCIKVAWYKRHYHLKANEPRPCVVCGKTFVKKFHPQARTCGRKCVRKLDYQRNRARYILRAVEWLKRNPERRREIWRKNYHKYIHVKRISARIRALKGNIAKSDWYQLCRALEFRCGLCLRMFPYERLTIDHVVPVSIGGASSLINLQPLCHRCNARKGNRPARIQFEQSPERWEWVRRRLAAIKMIRQTGDRTVEVKPR